MTDPTPSAMHLARNMPKSVSKSGELVELYSTPEALEFIARALDDAGLREAVETLEWIQCVGDGSVSGAAVKALADLTGTKEVNRD